MMANIANRTDVARGNNAFSTGKRRGAHLVTRHVALVLGTFLVAGCVQVTAPDKPIVINLNISVQQEVVYRLDGDAKSLIEEEAEIF